MDADVMHEMSLDKCNIATRPRTLRFQQLGHFVHLTAYDGRHQWDIAKHKIEQHILRRHNYRTHRQKWCIQDSQTSIGNWWIHIYSWYVQMHDLWFSIATPHIICAHHKEKHVKKHVQAVAEPHYSAWKLTKATAYLIILAGWCRALAINVMKSMFGKRARNFCI